MLRMKTILDPRVYDRIGYGPNRRRIRAEDYISVPVLLTYGSWKLGELLSMEDMAKLYILQKKLPRE